MDINVALSAARKWAKIVQDGSPDYSYEEAAFNLAVVWESIDGWLSSGGFLPNDWQRS